MVNINSKAVILAAGACPRLAPISAAMPKSLIKVAGKEIVDYQITGYLEAGVCESDITVVIGHMADKMTGYFEKKYPNVNIIVNKDYGSTNNMHSLYLALGRLLGGENQFAALFINNADCIYDAEIIKGLMGSKALNAIAAECDLCKLSKTAAETLYSILKEYIENQKDLTQWTGVALPKLFTREVLYPYDIGNSRWLKIDNFEDLAKADKLFSNFDPASKSAYILDLDGTLFVGSSPIKPALDWVKRHYEDYDFYFLTNNTSRTPSSYVNKLADIGGIIANTGQIITPLFPLSDYINENKFKSVYLVANKEVENYLKQQHPNVSFDYSFTCNQAVVLTYDTEVDFEKLNNVCILLNNKPVEYLATHADLACPTPKGAIPDVGSYIALIKSVTNKEPRKIFGKPDVGLVKALVKKYGKDKLAIAGDRLYTDKLLADNADIDFVCVLSGEATRYDVAADQSGKHPAIIVENLGELDMCTVNSPP